MKRLICVFTVLAFALTAFAACGKKDPGEAKTSALADSSSSVQEENSTESAASTAEKYVCGRCEITVFKAEDGVMRFEIEWGAGAMEYVSWQMSGVFDPETATVSYDDCVMRDHVLDENGADTAETAYENGTGSFTFGDGTLRWTDDMENVAEGMVFIREASAEN